MEIIMDYLLKWNRLQDCAEVIFTNIATMNNSRTRM